MSQFKRCGRKDLQIIVVYSYIILYIYIVLIGIWTVSDNQETLFSHGFFYEKWPRPWYKVGSQHDLGSPKIQLHTLTMRRSFVRASSCSRSKDGKGLADKNRGFGHPAITNRIPDKRQLMGINVMIHIYIYTCVYIYIERERDQYDMIEASPYYGKIANYNHDITSVLNAAHNRWILSLNSGTRFASFVLQQAPHFGESFRIFVFLTSGAFCVHWSWSKRCFKPQS